MPRKTPPVDGYSLFRSLRAGTPLTLRVKSGVYTLQFEGVKTGDHNWLRVTDAKGESIRLSPGWSTEACWNALTTIERGRWATPVGSWQDPAGWGGF